MTTQLKLRGGTTAEHATFAGTDREVTVDTDKNTLIVHDGSTLGGFELALATSAGVPDPLVLDDITASVTLTVGSYDFTESGGDLMVSFGGTNIMRLDSSGNLSVSGNLNTNQTL